MSYDVILVGGRPAGAGLAIRLAQQGRKVLVLDRATFPTLPQVPSCPAIHMGTLALIDELGIPESAVATTGRRIEDYVIRFGTWFDAPIHIPVVHGRNWAYCIDRAAFDGMMWEQLANHPTIERRSGFRVDALLKDGDRVVGVEGQGPDGPASFRAKWVVGADGRFSMVARMAGAEVREQRDEKASTVYFADWEGVGERAPGAPPEFEVFTDAAGTDILFMPIPGGRVTVCTHQRADRVDTGGDPEAYYRAQVKRYPEYATRFASARVVTKVVGLKKVGNGYRDPVGNGWALVGDAYHYKDPVDGQGIYDALLGGKILAEELGAALDGKKPEAEAMASYAARAHAATHAMFEATLGRLSMELYGPPPNAVVRTALRWLMTDPAYGERLFQFFGRDPSVDPARWRPPAFIAGALLRGMGRDIAGLFGRSTKALPGPAGA